VIRELRRVLTLSVRCRATGKLLDEVLRQLIRTRMKVIYGVQVMDSDGPQIERTPSAADVSKRYVEESARLGYNNLLSRNSFVLDVSLYVHRFAEYPAVLATQAPPTAWCSLQSLRTLG
jgi:hypothetical protein